MSNEGALKNVTKEMLEELYWGQRLSLPQIAKICGVTWSAIARRMAKLGIATRTISESKRGKPFYDRTGKYPNKETRRKLARLRWQDHDYATQIMAARNIRPNKAEEALEIFLNNRFPGEYEYTGDGSLIIKGMIPDFTNCNGKKEIIELFGSYYHSQKLVGDRWRQTELGRIMAFNSLGFRCLVIWENELKDKDKLLEKIRTFQGKRR